MDKVSVIRILREHEPELRAEGIMHLRLFGSLARDEFGPDSDVDLIADFDQSKRLSLIGMVHLENQLADLLGIKVDLSPEKSIKQNVLNRALGEAVLAF